MIPPFEKEQQQLTNSLEDVIFKINYAGIPFEWSYESNIIRERERDFVTVIITLNFLSQRLSDMFPILFD